MNKSSGLLVYFDDTLPLSHPSIEGTKFHSNSGHCEHSYFSGEARQLQLINVCCSLLCIHSH